MPTRACPVCKIPEPRKLTLLSELSSSVNYFRCDQCGHVGTVTKDDTRLVSNVTVSHDPNDPDDR